MVLKNHLMIMSFSLKITELTYPEVGEFLTKYVAGTTPIPYDFYLAKVGVTKATEKKPGSIFIKGQTPYIGVDKATKAISVRPERDLTCSSRI